MLIPRRDLDFHLFDVLGLEELLGRPRFAEHDRPTVDAVLDAAYALAASHFAPHAARTDSEEPRIEDGRVVLPEETRAALDAYAAGGFLGAAFPRPLGGLGLPFCVSQACGSVFAAGNVAMYSYALLTQGAANVIARFGSDDQRNRYLGAMLDGRAFGTMCLSEPQAGSSLADIRTTATPAGDGRYRITGRKMWISGGEHELGENIVHLVLARVPGGPPGVKGISLFIVPRFRAPAEGAARGAPNGVSLVGLNHKMGWRGHVNTALAFGDSGECLGELVGREHHGLGYMFHMMNEARVTVGLCAVGIGYAGYQYSLDYARNRPQGRMAGDKDPATPQVPIIRHADVRRMLLAQKAWVEGGLDLALYCARLVDDLATAEDDAARQALTLLLELLTPIAKSWPSEYGLEANKLAIQVAGGAGYTRDLPLERLYRDNRLNHIHEGTYGIHGLDLLGRKVVQQGGRCAAHPRREACRQPSVKRCDASRAVSMPSAARSPLRVRRLTARRPARLTGGALNAGRRRARRSPMPRCTWMRWETIADRLALARAGRTLRGGRVGGGPRPMDARASASSYQGKMHAPAAISMRYELPRSRTCTARVARPAGRHDACDRATSWF